MLNTLYNMFRNRRICFLINDCFNIVQSLLIDFGTKINKKIYYFQINVTKKIKIIDITSF